MGDQLSQAIIDKLFEDNPNLLVNHHLESFNEFYRDGIKRIFKEKNPIRIMKDQTKTGNFNLRCNIFLAGKMEISYITMSQLFMMTDVNTLCIQMRHD